ncbi:MAG TPA: hypothetical protein VIT91_07295 [Chthoniobacterales bacterium]
MRLAIIAVAFLWFLGSQAPAADDASFAAYLRETGLTPAECLERPPRELMAWIAERQKLGYTGTPGDEQTVIDLFYASYRATLRPTIDTRYPNAKTLREPLQKLHCFIYDFMASINGSRTYVTHERIAAYTEHILAELYSSRGATLSIAADSHPTDSDVVTFARLKAALWADSGRERPNYNRYTADLLSHLKAAEAADPSITALNLRFYIVAFIDQYVPLLNPNSFDFR